ncbi:CDP-alcohol phosphatidyltransferase family protein [Glutamicibacter sp. BW77]|uniref:CDP-alcohol phosphatidyltransferase family protein n=1 Tax=Glutamicibacter sp. BW77 TaxID=2024402 RepID=UPI000BB77B6F|nr:CDP-alcohol phosphatidyltransferase family protein [Glutamicibacter sp. BW77]PCC34444.1 hypothetical protein CIK74_10525 [Glutamicibacter sp. BW77]
MGNVERGESVPGIRFQNTQTGRATSGSRPKLGYLGQVSECWQELSRAQKGASKSAPAYSRYVNRRIGRFFAACAVPLGISPNQVTAVSAIFTFSGVALIALAPMSVAVGLVVAVLLAVGYALDSSDGQVARLQGSGSLAGEWLDHCVDAIKTIALPLSVAIGLWRHGIEPQWLLIVPLAACVIGGSTFFLMILTEQFRLRLGGQGVSKDTGTSGSLLRGLLVLPMDYGVMCWVFVLWGWPQIFISVYGLITVGAAGFLLLAMRKWYSDIRTLVFAQKDA